MKGNGPLCITDAVLVASLVSCPVPFGTSIRVYTHTHGVITCPPHSVVSQGRCSAEGPSAPTEAAQVQPKGPADG